ncbi:unnamed protein product, partial [Ascophyllum nodosum]
SSCSASSCLLLIPASQVYGVRWSHSSSRTEALSRRGLTSPSLCLDALRIALSQMNGRRWYTPTLQLQLTSLQVCALCRDVHPSRLIVGLDAPDWVWEGDATSDGEVKRLRNARVPTFRPRGVSWELPFSLFRQFSSELLASVIELGFGVEYKNKMDGPVSPAVIQKLNQDFNQPKAGITRPASPRLLNMVNQFNERIDGVKWPASLVLLRFGIRFDEPIDTVAWPASLRTLFLWGDFNQ